MTDGSEWSFYPSLAQDGAGVFHLTWMRWHLLPEGCVPAPALIDVFPYLYADHARQRWFVVWVNENGTLEMPIDGTFPADARSLDLPGYTPRIAASPTPGIYWGAWVEGVDPTQKVKHRFLAK